MCGKPDDFTVTLAGVKGVARVDDTLQAVSTSLKAIGVDARIVTEQSTIFYDSLLSPDKLKSKGGGIILTAWAADWPTGGGFMCSLIQPGSADNYAGLDDSAVNDMVEAADRLPDPADAATAWKRIDASVMADASMAPLVYDRHLLYRGPRLTNVYEHQVLGGVDLTALGVKP